ncbi:RNA polymerase sigma factor [Sphingomonas sp. QA11]|uniref:RNA polymerase sigma factor n=1 Tax=Sphingomonas sp. QA11 TaxID=2950605 RepID=UPI00234AD04A|nr:RNA polymerase sigma factor [Sphingomonas sp. QA11]WCM25927.1 RNA polymerase sigma factor [Sphingomonas sp. QA11]
MPPSNHPRDYNFAHPQIDDANPDGLETSDDRGRSALEKMYRSEASGLSAYFGRRLRGDDEASDYVQEVFARLARHMSRHSILDPRHYLRRIARNLLFERTRRLRTRASWQALPMAPEHEPWAQPDQSFHIELDDALKTYRRLLDELPATTRQVFLLHRVDELTYKQIGERLGISIPTVQYHVARALAHLDAALGQE